MDHKYSNYNQMRACVEFSPSQSKNHTLSTFLSRNRRKFEDSGKVLAVSVSEFFTRAVLQFSSTIPAYKMVITTVCVQIDNCFCNM